MGGGGFSMATDGTALPTPLDAFVLELGTRRSVARRRDRPRVCFVATASGDGGEYVARFRAAFETVADTSDLALFSRTVDDLEAFILDQDVVYVGGGNTASLLAVWRAHGVDRALRAAHEAGVVLAGLSAGALCWFDSGTTDSYGVGLAPLVGGLGFIAGSFSPHYDGETERRPVYQRLVGSGALPSGYAADDGAALVFDGPDLVEVVTERAGATAYRVEPVGPDRPGPGPVRETPLAARTLDAR